MLYAPATGMLSSFVHVYVARRGFGPVYQRLAWEYAADFPAPLTHAGWEYFLFSLDHYIEHGFGLEE